MKKYKVTLTAEERNSLQELIAGKAPAKKHIRARILLKADAAPAGPAWTDTRIAEALEVDVTTVERLRQRFVEEGLDAALGRKKQDRPSRPRTLDGKAEARLIAVACSEPPPGRARWTLRLLADKLVELEIVDTVSTETVRRTLKKRTQAVAEGAVVHPARGRRRLRLCDGRRLGGLPPALRRAAAAGVPGRVQQATDRRDAAAPAGRAGPDGARFDYEYERKGTANLFMISEPLLGWRTVRVTERRTAKDLAEVLRWLVEDLHPEAQRVVVVMDNLNTHKLASLYEAFPPEQARRIAEKLEIHHTPKHGSWLNMAEIELSALARQCLDQRLDAREKLQQETEAWESERNEQQVEIKWQFTTAEARIKLHRLYPVFQ